jgi:hypothetical protein
LKSANRCRNEPFRCRRWPQQSQAREIWAKPGAARTVSSGLARMDT